MTKVPCNAGGNSLTSVGSRGQWTCIMRHRPGNAVRMTSALRVVHVVRCSHHTEALGHRPEEPENWVQSRYRVGVWRGSRTESHSNRCGAEGGVGVAGGCSRAVVEANNRLQRARGSGHVSFRSHSHTAAWVPLQNQSQTH